VNSQQQLNATLEQLAEVNAEAEAISKIIDSGEQLDDSQQARWAELMDEDTGELATITAKKQQLEKVVSEQKRLLANRQSLISAGSLQPVAEEAPIEGAYQAEAKLPTVKNKFAGKLKAFKDDELGEAYGAGQWLKAVVALQAGRRDEQAEQKAARYGSPILATATEGTNSAGGYLVPDPVSAAIINVREVSGISRQICRVVPMTSDTLSIPKKTGTVTVDYPSEAAAITADDQTWGQVALTAVRRACLAKVSQDLVDDAIIPVIDDLAAEIGSDLAIQEDNELINGDGTSSYGSETGLVSSATQSTEVTGDWTAATMGDLTALMGKVGAKYWGSGASWIASAAFYHSVMLDLLADAGGNTLATLAAGAGQPSFLGYPVFLTDQLPTASTSVGSNCLFGAFDKAVIIGDRAGVRVQTSSERYFDEDNLAVRATVKYDINVHDASAYSELKFTA